MKRVKEWLKGPKYFMPAILLLVFLVAGSTLAWFTDAESAVNTISMGKNTITVHENPEGLAKKEISIANTGNVPVYVRMRVDVPEGVSYIDPSGEPKKLKAEYSPEQPEGWTKEGSDGYWYYERPVKPEETILLYDSVAFSVPEGELTNEEFAKIKDLLDITVYGESVQSEGLPANVTSAKGAFDYIATLDNKN